ANGQTLTQAFEGAGTVNRDAVTAYLKSHTFKTLIGEVDLRSQLQNIAYTVGQWQNGFFRSVAGVGVPESDLVPARVKTSWAEQSAQLEQSARLNGCKRRPFIEPKKCARSVSPAATGRGHRAAFLPISTVI